MYDYYRTPFLHQLATFPIPQVPSPQHLLLPSPHLVMAPSPQLSGYNLMITLVYCKTTSQTLQGRQLHAVSKADLCDQRDKPGPSTTPITSGPIFR